MTRSMLACAWGFLGLISALLVITAFLVVLLHAGCHPGDDVGAGSPLHHAYRQATTITWVGTVVCQLGTAMTVRTEHAFLRSVGLFTNN
jgi:magnesium-transporting ATPase (P-type)